MAVTAKSIADGTCATTRTAIYTVPAATKAYVRHAVFYNAGTTSASLLVYLTRSGGTARVVDVGSIPAAGRGVSFDESALTMSTGDAIEVEASTGNVTYVVTGAEET
jgi:hypothetical protein